MAILPLFCRPRLADDDRVYAQIVLFNGFDPLDATAPFEVLAAGS
ncbi:MAG: DJ-1/PfpI family protein, partial [Mycobacterium sp.]